MLTAREIEQNYLEFDDEKITRIALNDARGLKKDIIPIIENQIRIRKLDPFLIDWIKAEREPLGIEELDNIKETLNHLPCPLCKAKNDNLFGFKIYEVFSIIIDCSSEKKELICCHECGRQRRKESNLTTLIFGWWSLFGIILTPIAILRNLMNSSMNRTMSVSNPMIHGLINDNRGTIRLSDDINATMQDLLYDFNKDEI